MPPTLLALAAVALDATFWAYASIPVVSALVGWGTNRLAIVMMFYPLDPIGRPPWLGWQGVIPAKAAKMAARTVDAMTERILRVEDVYARLDPQRVVRELEPVLDAMFEQIIDDVMQQQAPRRWRLVPARIKQEIYARARRDAPEAIARMMADVGDNIANILDLKALCIDALTRDKDLLNKIFQRCGRAEFRFIARSGFYFGFLFGLVQMTAWYLWPEWWMLPLFGLIVGWATNWLALKMIFEPVEPRHIGPWTWQGLFLKRQAEVSDEYANLVASHILNPQNMLHAILRGPRSDEFFLIISRHLSSAIDAWGGFGQPLARLALGTETYEQVKKNVCDRVLERLPASMQMLENYSGEAMDIERTLRERMRQLPPSEFEKILHSAFQEDEILLILVGAALGLAVGFAQLFFVFGG